MSDRDPGLVLHVPFSDALDAGPIDRSAKRHEVTVVGRPLLVADATLGAAHRFADGQHLQVIGLDLADPPAFTLSLWVKREAAEERVQLFALGAADHGQLVLYLWPDGIPELYLDYPGAPPAGFSMPCWRRATGCIWRSPSTVGRSGFSGTASRSARRCRSPASRSSGAC